MHNLWTVLGSIIILAVLGWVYYLGYRRGYQVYEEQVREDSQKAEDKREEIEKDIAKRPDDVLDRDLDRWMRD